MEDEFEGKDIEITLEAHRIVEWLDALEVAPTAMAGDGDTNYWARAWLIPVGDGDSGASIISYCLNWVDGVTIVDMNPHDVADWMEQQRKMEEQEGGG